MFWFGRLSRHYGVGITSLEMDSLKVNDDGSVDLYFAPSGPEVQLFDQSWKLPDTRKIK